MSVIIFIAILVVLILVHEFGHFIVAKRSGVRVDEFGLGYPPKLFGFRKGETLYTLNLLPFGGFVKIYGEDPTEVNGGPDTARSLAHKPKWKQIAVLVAGIVFNAAFAWLLISGSYVAGVPSSADAGLGAVKDAKLLVIGVSEKSPAQDAGFAIGDAILSVRSAGGETATNTPDGVSAFIKAHQDETLVVRRLHDGVEVVSEVAPREGIVEGQKIVGISMDMIGTLKLPLHKALWQGLKTSWNITAAIAAGLWGLIHDALVGRSDLSQVTGPVGMAGIVGDVSQLGWSYLITFTAFISLNLALINLIPFPALDGGRILFVLIEAIRRKPMNANATSAANMIGFVLLLALMAAVTFNDISKLL